MDLIKHTNHDSKERARSHWNLPFQCANTKKKNRRQNRNGSSVKKQQQQQQKPRKSWYQEYSKQHKQLRTGSEV